MKEEFVPYELALRMKVLGFDEPCFGWYNWTGTDLTLNNRSYVDINPTNAPTWHQAFRWFREEHNLCGYVRRGLEQMHKHLKENGFTVQDYEWNLNKTDGSPVIGVRGMKSTYQEAEIDCLEKLIEIVEEKSKL